MILTPNQIEELLAIIEYTHVFFIAKTIGTEILSDKDKAILKENGILIEGIPKETLLKNAFKFGVLADSLGDKNTKGLNYEDFKKYIKAGKYIPLTVSENNALESLKHQAYRDIKGLGNVVSKDLRTIYIDADLKKRAKYEKVIEETAKEVIENRGSVKDMISALGHKTEDWTRDLGRISEYIMHTAYEEGRAASIEAKNEGDAYVFKDVYPGACKYCIKHYLTEGVGSQPRIFKLSVLRANGTNVGRKPEEWLPVLGPMHPFCRCTINELIRGMTWDNNKKSFEFPLKWERQVQRKSKIKITIGDKNYEV